VFGLITLFFGTGWVLGSKDRDQPVEGAPLDYRTSRDSLGRTSVFLGTAFLLKFDDGRKVIELSTDGIDLLPDLTTRFSLHTSTQDPSSPNFQEL
jgi:hypothetical protein